MRRVRVAVVLGVLLAAPAAGAQEKTYTFPEVRIEATILADGTLDLVERRTFDFKGSFGFAFFTIDWPERLIEGFAVSAAELGGAPLPVTTETDPATGGFKGTWYFSAADQRVTFEISYRARCGVDVHADAAHLLWQFVGRGWDRGTDSVHVRVHIPGRATGGHERPLAACEPQEEIPPVKGTPLAAGDVRAWGHGPLGGEVAFADPQTVTFAVRDLPATTFLEGSILFPVESVPLAHRSSEAKRDEILAEEGRLAEEANELRRRYLGAERTGGRLLILVPVLLLGLAGAARLRDRVPGVPRHLDEPPEEIHPAELAYLWSAYQKRVSPRNAYRAQLLHLAQRGIIEIAAVGRVSDPEDFEVTLVKQPSTGLDREFVEFLFAGAGKKKAARLAGEGKAIRLKGLSTGGKRGEELREWLDELKEETRDHVHRLTIGGIRAEAWLLALVMAGVFAWSAGTIGLGVTLLAAIGGLVAGAILSLTIGGLRRGGAVGALVMVAAIGVLLPMAIPLLVLAPAGDLPIARVALVTGIASGAWVLALRLTPERLPRGLRDRMARWRAFRRFLRRFSSLPDAPTMAVVIWERYLVYATALGVAGRVARQVRALVPADQLPPPIRGAPTGFDGVGWVHSFNAAHVPAVAFGQFVSPSTSSGSSFSSGVGSFSSGGGGGGGFSGGGGGGGGGTGGGAG